MTEDDKVKAGYQAAVALISYEGQLIWRAFSGMLAANSVFIGVAAAVLKLFPNQLLAAKVLAILGLLICGAWFFVLRRQFSYYRYWFAWARHFEKKWLAPEVRITSLGKTFGEGGTIEQDEVTPALPAFSWTARVFRVEWLMTLVVLVFGTLYVLLLKASLGP